MTVERFSNTPGAFFSPKSGHLDVCSGSVTSRNFKIPSCAQYEGDTHERADGRGLWWIFIIAFGSARRGHATQLVFGIYRRGLSPLPPIYLGQLQPEVCRERQMARWRPRGVVPYGNFRRPDEVKQLCSAPPPPFGLKFPNPIETERSLRRLRRRKDAPVISETAPKGLAG